MAAQRGESQANGRDAKEEVEMEDYSTSPVRPPNTAKQKAASKGGLDNTMTLITFLLISLCIVLFNKWLYEPTGGDFPFPLALMVMHQTSLYLMTLMMRFGMPMVKFIGIRQQDIMPGLSIQWTWWSWLRTFIPIGFFQGSTLAFGNVALATGTVHMALMIKAVKPVLCYLLALLIGRETLSVPRLKILSAVSLGCFITIKGDLSTSVAGIVTCFLATSTDGIRLILTQGSMQDRKLDAFTTLAYVSPVSLFFVTPVAFIYEWDKLKARAPQATDVPAIGMSTVLAIALNVASNTVLSRLNAVVMVLAGILKDFILIVISSWMFNSAISLMQLGGYTIAVIAMQVYSECSKNAELFERNGVLTSIWVLLLGPQDKKAPSDLDPELAGYSRASPRERPAE
jgi:hypothetical protein